MKSMSNHKKSKKAETQRSVVKKYRVAKNLTMFVTRLYNDA